MNLHQIVSGAIRAVNPFVHVSIAVSNGYTTGADGKRTPAYLDAVTVEAQVQQLTTRDLRQLEALNVQGSERTLYVNGEINAIVRLTQLGGDLITLPDGSVWLTTHVLEDWTLTAGWSKVAITLQDGA